MPLTEAIILPSMLQQSLRKKEQAQRRHQECRKRAQAVTLLQEQSIYILEISSITGVSQTLVGELNSYLLLNQHDKVDKLLDPDRCVVGCPPVFSVAEQCLLVENILQAAQHGFAVDKETLNHAMSRNFIDV